MTRRYACPTCVQGYCKEHCETPRPEKAHSPLSGDQRPGDSPVYTTSGVTYTRDDITRMVNHHAKLIETLEEIINYAGMRHEAEKRVEIMKKFAIEALHRINETQ